MNPRGINFNITCAEDREYSKYVNTSRWFEENEYAEIEALLESGEASMDRIHLGS